MTYRLPAITLALLIAGFQFTAANKSDTGISDAAQAMSPHAHSSHMVAAGGNAAHGKALYSANCSSCHGADGGGGGVGPSLKGEKARKNLAAVAAWIKNPQPPMPKLYPSPLSTKDVADVSAYVETL